MSAESVIYDRLAADASLNAIVSGRIYPVRAPQRAAIPLVTYQRVGGAPLNGSTAVSGTYNPQMQIDCIGTSYRETKAIADAIRASLNKWFTQGLKMSLTAEHDDYDTPVHADEQGVFRVIQEYSIWHN